jgi:O-antigen ligase
MPREKLFFYSVCLVAFLIPFDIKITNSIILISFALWLLSARENVRANWPVFNRYFFLFASLYLINIPGLIHTENLSAGFGRLESRLGYIAFPLMIFFSTIDRQQFRKIGYSFCLGVVIAGLYCVSVSLNAVFHTDPAARSFAQVTYLSLLTPLELHPTYFSIFVSFCIFFLLHELFTALKGSRKRWLLIPVIACFAGLNFLIQSRAPLAAFLLILLIGIAFTVFTLKNKFQKRIAFAVIALVMAGVLVNYKKVLTRFDLPFRKIPEMVLKPDGSEADVATLSTVYHLRSWYCAVLLLSDYHMVTGFGAGDEKDILQPCYLQHGWITMADERQNAHNEYLSAMLRMGIPEFSLLLCCLLIPCYLSIKHSHFLYTAFLLLWMASFFFTTLNLQSALFFYTLFNALFFRTLILETATPPITFQTTKDTLPAVS